MRLKFTTQTRLEVFLLGRYSRYTIRSKTHFEIYICLSRLNLYHAQSIHSLCSVSYFDDATEER